MFSIIFPENSEFGWTSSPLMTSCPRRRRGSILGHRTYQKTNTSSVKMPPTHQKIWPIMNMFPVFVFNNWYFGQTNGDNLQPVPIPQTTNGLACRIFSLSCCDCNTPSSEMGWSRCHTSFTKHLQMFFSFGTVTQATEPLALRCELHLTKHPAVFETAAKAVEKKKNATRQMYHPKKSSSKKTRRFGWFLQCVSDFLKENAWNKSKIHWSVGPSLRSQETSGASQSSWGPCKRLGLNSRIEPKTCKNYNHYASEKKFKVHGIVPVQSRVNLSIPGALRVSDKKNVPAIVASVKTIFRSLVFKKRMEFHNNQSSATCVVHVVLKIPCSSFASTPTNSWRSFSGWGKHTRLDSTRWHN